MENSNSPDDARKSPAPTGRLTEAERQAIRERSAQARAAASDALAHYVVLLEQVRERIGSLEQKRVFIDATRELLRNSVQRYALLLKALDTPPERMLRLVKETVTNHVPHPEREDDTRGVLEDVVAWCIEAYYGSAPAA